MDVFFQKYKDSLPENALHKEVRNLLELSLKELISDGQFIQAEKLDYYTYKNGMLGLIILALK